MSMKTIEERAKECTRRRADVFVGTTLASIFEKGYIAGATDQKTIDESIRLKKCDAMSKEEFERETTFLEQYIDGKGDMPSVSDAIEWARKDLLDKACYIFCHIGCPHKTDSYNCLKGKCDTWKTFRRSDGGAVMKTIEERAKEYASKKADISRSAIYNEALVRNALT